MLGDVAVRHPKSRVGYVEKDVDSLAGSHEHGVFPNQIALCLVISRENDEPARAVNVERMMHRVV